MTNDVSPQILQAFLNSAWQRAPAAANSLRDTLVTDQTDALTLVSSGSLASVGKNSANQSYKGYGAGSLTQVQIVETLGNLLALYDQLVGQIKKAFACSADFNYAVPAGYDPDADVYTLMTQVFNSVNAGGAQMLPDITGLRLPACIDLGPTPRTW